MIDRTFQPEIQELTQFNILQPVRTALPNGIPLSVINAGEQEVVRIDVLFAGGRWQQSQKLQALFTNRMLREGSRKFSAAVISEKLDFYGAWLELSSSADYAYITMYSLNKYFAETMEVLESVIKEPLFPEKELSTVIDANIQQYLVNTSKVGFLAHRSLLKALYGEQHPCGQHIEEADYHAITPAVLKAFYNQYYHSGNCDIYLSGKVTDDIIHKVETTLGAEPFGNLHLDVPKKDFVPVPATGKRIFTERGDAMQSAVKLGMNTITRQNPDYMKLRVLVTLLGGYFGSRLMSNIREDKGYTYGISAGIMSYPDSSLLAISTETDNKYVEPLIAEVYNEIDKLQQTLVSFDELAMVRNYMLGEMCRNYESPFSLADAWMFIKTSGVDDTYFSRSLQAIKEVTPEEIRNLAERYLCKEKLKEVIAGKKLA